MERAGSVWVSRFVGFLAVSMALAAAGCGSGQPSVPRDSAVEDEGVEDIGEGMDASLENPGFPVPTAATEANMESDGVWSVLGPADWSCLDTPGTDAPSTQGIALAGSILDEHVGTGIGGATVTAFPGISVDGDVGTATSSNVAATQGEYAMSLTMLPVGETRVGFAIEAAGYVKTYALNHYLDPADATQTLDLGAVAVSWSAALPAVVGASRDVTAAAVLGRFRDCAGRPVSNAVVTVSSTQGTVTHVPGAETFYFSTSTENTPVPHTVSATMNQDGRFMVLNATPTSTAYVQVWGYVNPAALAAGTLTLLAEQRVPLEANTFVAMPMEALRAD